MTQHIADTIKNKRLKKVCLLSDHHLAVNPRLWKEAFLFEKIGCEVVILNMWQSAGLLELDQQLLKGHSIVYKAYLNLVGEAISSFSIFWMRARKKLAGYFQKYFKIGTRWAISLAPEMMVKSALRENADLYVAHLECGLYAGKKLVKKGKKVSFDFEDWYSRDYLIPTRPVTLLARLEKFALRNGLFCTTTSKALSSAFAKAYDCSEPAVIYNSFPASDKGKTAYDPKANEPARILWFSRTIGPQRGLEYFLNALASYETGVELTLVGNMRKGFKELLEKKISELPQHKVVACPFLSSNELKEFIAEFSIGLAIEEPVNDNKLLTVSNKILQYLEAGLFVIASDTPGQREVAESFPGRIALVDLKDSTSIHSALERFRNPKPCKSVFEEEEYKKAFSWEAQERKLYELLTQHYTLPKQLNNCGLPQQN